MRSARDSGGLVHVYGPRESAGMLSLDERVCTSTVPYDEPKEGRAGLRVVYHHDTKRLATGRWLCLNCGERGPA